MPTANTRLQDRAIDRAHDLQRFANGVILRIIATLNRSDTAIAAELAMVLERLDPGTFTVERLNALLGSVRALNSAAYVTTLAALEPEMRGLADAESQYQAATFIRTIPTAVKTQFPIAAVSAEQVYAAALSRPFQGRLLSEWGRDLEASRLTQIRNAIRQGYVEGKTTADIVRTIRGTKALHFEDGILARPRRELATVVQTALSHTAQRARAQFYKANSDLVKAVVWTATLDNRTTPECAVRDGLQYTADEHEPIGHAVPWLGGPGALHFNCRSVDVPVTASWRELGIPIDEMSPSERASMDGAVPAETTYAEWITRQSAARQDDILGPARGELLRSGTRFEKFSNDKGQWLTLAQLRARDP